MYCIAFYDIGEKSVGKMLRMMRKYLNWIQNSVFEGYITENNLIEMCDNALGIMDEETDSFIVFTMQSDKYIEKLYFGKDISGRTSNII